MPMISIIVPCFNEQGTIRTLLEAVRAQTRGPAGLEVVIADGLSTDHTREEIARFAAAHPEMSITVVDNPKRIIPAALNCALAQARGEILLRLDAHSIPYPEYVERSVADLEAGLGDNVGGVWEIRPRVPTWAARSIAAAAAHPLGVGDALYRHADQASAVDTVPFGAFRRELLSRIGTFDETLQTNEDYEFNARIRQHGGRVWLDPAIRSVYLAQPTFSGLARQYARYGFWKWRMLRRYPRTLRWRQGLPPLFVLGLTAGGLLASLVPPLRPVWAAAVLIYMLLLAAAGLQAALQRREIGLAAGLPAAIATMHICWGAGFLWSMIEGILPGKAPRP